MKYFTTVKIFLFYFLLFGVIHFYLVAKESDEPFLEKTRIFHRELSPPFVDYRYNYRLPSLVVTKDGTVLAFANKRKAPQNYPNLNIRDWGHESDVSLLRSTDKGESWEEERVLASKDCVDIHCGPALIDYQKGRIFKFMRYHPAWDYDSSKEYAFSVPLQKMRDDGYGDYYVFSDDDGQTWSEPEPIYLPYPENAYGCGVGNGIHGIQLTNGRLVIQAKYYLSVHENENQKHRVLFYSDDHGITWHHGADINFDNSISPQEFPIVETNPNEIYISFRNTSGYRVIMRSKDGGLTVSNPIQDKNLPGPNCHAGLVQFPGASETAILFSCPRLQWDDSYKNLDKTRKKMTIYFSSDGGDSWFYKRTLCDGLAAYSDISCLPDSSIICLYETGQDDMHDYMEFARFNLAWVEEYVETDSLYQEITVFQAGTEGYSLFRKPTIIQAPNNDLVAFCEGRKNSNSDTGDIDVLMKRSVDNGLSWSDVSVIWDDSVNTCCNPSSVIDQESGKIFLLMTWNNGADDEPAIIDQVSIDTRRVFVVSSNDNGNSWSNPTEITDDVKSQDLTWFVTGPVHGIQMEKGEKRGRLIVPCNYVEANTKNRYCTVIFSDDHGLTWQAGGTVSDAQVGECTIAELSNGDLMINMMNYERSVYKNRKIAISEDGGNTWSGTYFDNALIEPKCQASLLRYSYANEDNSRLLFSNPALTYSEANLTVKMSYDEGSSWSNGRRIYRGSSSYSDFVKLKDNTIGLLYERDANLKINFVRFNLFWLTYGYDSYRMTSVPEMSIFAIPSQYKLINFPNPFNSETIIHFNMPQNIKVQIDIFDILGKKIKRLTNANYCCGSFHIKWNAKDDFGFSCPSGMYICRISMKELTLTRKMILLR